MLKNPLKVKVIVRPTLKILLSNFRFFVRMYVRMYARTYVLMYVSFLMIKSGVFVSALKIDGYNKNKC